MNFKDQDCEIFTTVAGAWEAMLKDCEQAQTSIYFEQYIFQPDEIGKKFIELLVRKAKEGVEVRLLLDLVGSWVLFRNRKLCQELQMAGIRIRWYNPIVWLFFWRAASLYFRDHRKILLIDGKIGHTGGVGVNADMISWRDTHARLVGPVVEAMNFSFLELWLKARKPFPHLLSRPPARVYGGPTQYEFLPNSAGHRKRYIYYAMRDAIRSAEQRVWITMPYFIPDLRIFKTLRLAAKRGVDVRVLLPGQSDVPLMDAAMRSYFGMALKSGIRIYAYQPVVLHAKVVICDQTWATFGSMNWDNTSFRYNLEGNVVVSNKATITELSEQFMQDLVNSVPLDYRTWDNRPFKQKFIEFLLWPFHFLL